MKLKINTYLMGIFCGVLISSVALGIGTSVFSQQKKITSLYKKYLLMSHKPKVATVKQGQELIAKEEPTGLIEIMVNATKKKGKVSHLLYGTNLAPKMETSLDIINFAKNMGITCFRFPGGGSPGYHWETGAFDFDARVANVPLRDINYVIEFCKRTDTKLVIQVNVESGTAQEAAGWVEFMNKKSGFFVEYWQLGDEVYGSWDKAYMSADKYAQLIKEFSLAMKKVDPSIKIGMDWAPEKNEKFNIAVIKQAGTYIDFAACHWYPNHIKPTHSYQGRIHPYPKEVMANYLQIPAIASRVKNIAAEYANKNIEVTFMGWDGAWDGPSSDFPPYSQGIVQWSLANAIFYADCLGQFALNGVTVSANFDFQSIGFGFIRGWDKEAGWGGQRWDGEIIRPKALAIKLFSNYFGDILLDSEVKNSPSYYKENDWWADSYTGNVPYISCYASKFSQEKKISLVLINKHDQKAYKVKVLLQNIQPKEKAFLRVLSGPDLLSQNEGNPTGVRIREFTVENIKQDFSYTVPAHSVNLITLEYE